MVSSSYMKLSPKTVQGSDDNDEVNESEEINGEQRRDESWQMLWGKTNPTPEVVPGNCVAVILWLFLSVLMIWTRKQFVLFPVQFITILTQLLASQEA